MLIRALPLIFRKRSRRARRRDTIAPPPAGNRILSVAHGGAQGDDVILVTISGTLVEIADYGLALEVLDGEEWRAPFGGNFDNLPEVFLLFDRDVSATAQWRVEHPEVWIFGGGANLGPPLSGSIE